jgi:hypothetical protein
LPATKASIEGKADIDSVGRTPAGGTAWSRSGDSSRCLTGSYTHDWLYMDVGISLLMPGADDVEISSGCECNNEHSF